MSLLETFFKTKQNNLAAFASPSQVNKAGFNSIVYHRSSLSFRLVSGFTTIVKFYKTWDNMFTLRTVPVVMS